MTQEEKAKAYDEAIERAKGDYIAYKKVGDIAGIDALTSVFPQLTESEEERIRNLLRRIVITANDGDLQTLGDNDTNKCLAWLEKQKEQKPTELSDDFELALEQFLMNADSSSNTFAEDVKKYANRLREIARKENKPAEWSEEDEKMVGTIISDGSRGVELDSKQVAWLKSLRPQPHWKPGEEQMVALARATNRCVGVDDAKILIKLLEQLKSL